MYSHEVIEKALEDNKKFVQLFWSHGILNYVQAQILEKKDYKSIYSNVPIRFVLQHYQPQNKKDRIFSFCLTNRCDLLLKLLVLMKYKILLPNKKLYSFVKQRFMKR